MYLLGRTWAKATQDACVDCDGNCQPFAINNCMFLHVELQKLTFLTNMQEYQIQGLRG